MGESISTIQHSPRKSMSYKFAAPRYRLPPMALQTVQVSVEPRLSTATHKAEMALNDRLVYSSCLKHANEMVLGDPRQAHQRTQSLHFPSSFINHSTVACCSSAQTPSSLSNAWTLDRLRTRRRVGSMRRRGNHMHDHSRFQRDIEWRHRRLSLSLSLPLTKVTHAQYRKRFRASYNGIECILIFASGSNAKY